VAKVVYAVSMPLDGFVAGKNQSVENPLGEGGEQLHRWLRALSAWRAMHGLEQGEENVSSALFEEDDEGAIVMGRNMFGGGPGPWGDEPWTGWWGDDRPFHKPVFVLTHHPRPPLVAEGGTTFTFVTDGIESALRQARHAAGSRNVSVSGGGHVAAQYLAAGLIDEIRISLVPVLLKDGVRLFDLVQDASIRLEQTRVLEAPGVTHISYRTSLGWGHLKETRRLAHSESSMTRRSGRGL
jgi:dihydrofolate reductase